MNAAAISATQKKCGTQSNSIAARRKDSAQHARTETERDGERQRDTEEKERDCKCRVTSEQAITLPVWRLVRWTLTQDGL